MYTPASFHVEDRETLRLFMRKHSFAAVVSADEKAGLTGSHLPLLLRMDEAGNDILSGHMARANPQWREFESGAEVLAMFQGPHGYVSPSWYADDGAVPTWNYTSVHAYGVPEIVDAGARLESMVDAAVEHYESGFEKPWKGDLQETFRQKLLKAIVGFEIRITRMEGKFKLG